MKNNKGITMVTLIITIVVLLIIASISIGTGNNIIRKSQLENIKTDMLLIKVKGKEYVENASFDLGTSIDTVTVEEKAKRIEKAKSDLKGEEITSESIFFGNINITAENISDDNANYKYYYKLSNQDLVDMGIGKVKSDEENGYYILKYDVLQDSVEVINTKGFEKDDTTYYTLSDIQDLNI